MGRDNIAFIGSGNWARKYHFPALAHVRDDVDAPAIRLRGIFSLDQGTAQAVATQYGFERVYASMHEVLADDEIDAFAVAVSPEALVSVIEQIAPRGLPIFSEKPPGISSAQAQRLADLVTTTNVVAFNRRFIPLNNVFKKIVDEMDDLF